MNSHAVRSIKLGAMFAVALAIGQATVPSPASAQVIERGIQGGVAGAIIGGIIDGGKGAGRGAAIGAGIGVVTGAIERDNAQRAYAYGPAPYGSSNLVYDTQVALYELGYDPGPPDGVYGRRTADAIAQYEYAARLPVTGRPSQALLDHMHRYGG
jgi:peptidoglycan hydrolase-like protein with peptidoglycan-binding domain